MKEQDKDQHESQIKEQVEKIGVFLEQKSKASAITPLAGRLFAYLLLSDPPYRNFYEIEEFLQASKSSISTALKALTNSGIVDYFTISGDRKRYFRVNTDRWLEVEKQRIQDAVTAMDMAQDVLHFRKGSEFKEFNEGVEKLVDFYSYISEGLQKMIDNWSVQHRAFHK